MTEPADTGAEQPEPFSPPAPPPADATIPTAATPPSAAPAYGSVPAGYTPAAAGPVGKVRGTGVCILLAIVTIGIYSLFWYYNIHKEMNSHRNGQGIGGGLALVLAFFVGFVMPFLTASEVGAMYEARGQQKPVSGVTGCWIFLPFIGGIIWFVKTNGALNNYWTSLGATS